MQDVTFPETLKSLDERSFGGCSAFTRIIIDIPAIANYAFWNCANVTSIDLGEKVTSIGRNAFISASNLQTITCRAENAPSLGNSAFGSAGGKVEGAKILYVPAASYDAYETAWTDVTSQGYALQDINDQQLTDGIYYRASRETDWVPTLPATFTALYVRTVGDDAALTASQFNTVITKISAQSAPVTLDLNMAKFEATEFPTGLAGNAKLGTIKFFENTASIAAGAFKGCTALTKATVPTGVEIIGESTFEGCTALASLTLPSSVKTVGDKAFKGCSALVETSLSAIENIGTEAFAGTGLTSAKISATTLGEKSLPRLYRTHGHYPRFGNDHPGRNVRRLYFDHDRHHPQVDRNDRYERFRRLLQTGDPDIGHRCDDPRRSCFRRLRPDGTRPARQRYHAG